MKFFATIFSLVFLAGCATSTVSEFRGPDGSTVKSIKCTSDPQKCFVAATQSCPNGTYRVISSESHAGGAFADLIPGPVTWYGMSYSCGPSDGKMPDFKFQGPRDTPLVMPSSPPQRKSTITNCNKAGSSITCNTY